LPCDRLFSLRTGSVRHHRPFRRSGGEPSPELLAKARRFAELYPKREDVQELETVGVNWTRLYLAFAVPGRGDRHALLREAVRERWSDQQHRFTVQQRFPSRRRGVGGRPRRPVTSHGPEVTLRELERQCRRWLGFHEQGWQGVKDRDWGRFVRGWPVGDLDTLLQPLRSADGALKEVGRQAVFLLLPRQRRRAQLRARQPRRADHPPVELPRLMA
jgi:hypothetical protein